MRTSKSSLASKSGLLSVLALAFLVAPEGANAFNFFDSEPDPIMEEIIVIGQRQQPRDTELNRLISEQAEMAYIAELQRLLAQTQADILQIDDLIQEKEDEVAERCRAVKTQIEEGTAACEDVAQNLNYVCLGGAVALGSLSSGTAGGIAALACTIAYDDALARCAANPGGGITDILGTQIDEYCPDAR